VQNAGSHRSGSIRKAGNSAEMDTREQGGSGDRAVGVWSGIVTEVFYPTVDRPQLRDLQYLITDGKTFFHEEKRDLDSKTQRICDHAPGYRCTNGDPEGRYTIEKDIIGNPDAACLLQRTLVTSSEGKSLAGLKLYALCAPHLEVGGAGTTAM
jgi:glucoamylase